MDVAVENAVFAVFVRWWSVGEPAQLKWVIQLHERRGLLARLLGRKATEKQWMTLRIGIDAALSGGVAESSRWINLDELEQV